MEANHIFYLKAYRESLEILLVFQERSETDHHVKYVHRRRKYKKKYYFWLDYLLAID